MLESHLGLSCTNLFLVRLSIAQTDNANFSSSVPDMVLPFEVNAQKKTLDWRRKKGKLLPFCCKSYYAYYPFFVIFSLKREEVLLVQLQSVFLGPLHMQENSNLIVFYATFWFIFWSCFLQRSKSWRPFSGRDSPHKIVSAFFFTACLPPFFRAVFNEVYLFKFILLV